MRVCVAGGLVSGWACARASVCTGGRVLAWRVHAWRVLAWAWARVGVGAGSRV